MKKMASLTPADFRQWPVWEWVDIGDYATWVKPVRRLPVDTLDNRIVGTKVILANGKRCWATLCNILLMNQKATEHFLTLSIKRNGKWFHLARYHDVDIARHGPSQLASFLGLAISDVFPIKYDVSAFAKGLDSVVAGTIQAEPAAVLSEQERIRMAVESTRS